MCGIAGFIGEGLGLTPERLARMRDALAHRGPDDYGLKAWTAAGAEPAPDAAAAVGLAHRRLSIIDLSPAGHQPMSNEDGTVWIVFNGEFYNFADYRAELEAQGHVFRSHSDTETILHLYEEHGIEEALRRINGMFAFALWDSRRRRLVLARDRLGKKPLFYAWRPGRGLAFASEIKALRAGGLVDDARLDLAALDQVWTFGVTVGERTLFEQVRKLPPAHYAIFENDRLELHEYWDAVFRGARADNRLDGEWVDELDALLRDAIRLRLVSDVPVGLFLSGGVDSSLVAALAADITGGRIRSYTIGFQEDAFNEAPQARAVADHLGLKNETLCVTDDLFGEAGRIARQFDEPFGDSSAVPTYCVSKLSRKFVTVALTGDGGDESFAGYDYIRQAVRMWGSAEYRRRLRRPMSPRERLWEFKQRLLGFERGFLNLDSLLSRKRRRELFTEEFLRTVPHAEAVTDRFRWMERTAGADVLSRVQYLLVKTWLPDDFLRKVDTVSMAHALECRSPLLDYRVVEFAARLPDRLKFEPGGRGKRILRLLLQRYVPEELYDRPKRGFGLPWEHWCRGSAGRRLKTRWEQWKSPWFRPEAAAMLFPEDRVGVNFLQWAAFATLEHFQPETGS